MWAAILPPGPSVEAAALPFGAAAPEAPSVGAAVSLAALEEAHIRRVVAASATLEAAAETLGIDSVTLWRRRKQYGI